MGFGAIAPKKRVRDTSRQAQNRRDLSARFDGIVDARFIECSHNAYACKYAPLTTITA